MQLTAITAIHGVRQLDGEHRRILYAPCEQEGRIGPCHWTSVIAE